MLLDRTQLMRALELKPSEVPVALILEGSWWQQKKNKLRLSKLEHVRELPFPEMHLGYYQDRPLLYSCVYGAPRAVEPVHIFASLGAQLVVMIGSCGAIQRKVNTGDIVLPRQVRIGEGASQYYAEGKWAEPSEAWVNRAENALRSRGFLTHQGLFITTSALFAQPLERVQEWESAGYLGVDMETSAVFTVAKALGMEGVSMVFVWDELHRQRTFLDEFSAEEKDKQQRADLATYEVALELAAQVEVL
jgi:uridine phosphorylase